MGACASQLAVASSATAPVPPNKFVTALEEQRSQLNPAVSRCRHQTRSASEMSGSGYPHGPCRWMQGNGSASALVQLLTKRVVFEFVDVAVSWQIESRSHYYWWTKDDRIDELSSIAKSPFNGNRGCSHLAKARRNRYVGMRTWPGTAANVPSSASCHAGLVPNSAEDCRLSAEDERERHSADETAACLRSKLLSTVCGPRANPHVCV